MALVIKPLDLVPILSWLLKGNYRFIYKLNHSRDWPAATELNLIPYFTLTLHFLETLKDAA